MKKRLVRIGAQRALHPHHYSPSLGSLRDFHELNENVIKLVNLSNSFEEGFLRLNIFKCFIFYLKKFLDSNSFGSANIPNPKG